MRRRFSKAQLDDIGIEPDEGARLKAEFWEGMPICTLSPGGVKMSSPKLARDVTVNMLRSEMLGLCHDKAAESIGKRRSFNFRDDGFRPFINRVGTVVGY